VEALRKLGLHGDLDDCHICPQGKLKHSKFSRRTSYAQQLLERVHSDVMGPFIEGYWGEKYCLLFIDEMLRNSFIKTLKSRSEVTAAEERWSQDYKTKVRKSFLRQEGISHDVTERYCPQSNGLAERLNLTIMDKVCCMLIDTNLTPKLWPYAAHYPVLIYNNLPHSALDNHKSPNDAYGDLSDFSKLYVFGSICYDLQPSKLLHNLEARSTKGLFLGIDPACFKVLNLQRKSCLCSKNCEGIRWQVSLYRRKSNSRPLLRRGTNILDPTPARLEDSRDSP